MEIMSCLKKIYPDWKGVVWNNSYEGIKPHELEKRPIPKLEELEAVWPQAQADQQKEIETGALDSKIHAEIRAMAIERLQLKGDLPKDFKI